MFKDKWIMSTIILIMILLAITVILLDEYEVDDKINYLGQEQ